MNIFRLLAITTITSVGISITLPLSAALRDPMDSIDTWLTTLTPDEHSLLEKKLKQQNKLSNNSFGIAFYESSYVLPFYRTTHPDRDIYARISPQGPSVRQNEFKAKMSVVMPLGRPFANDRFSVHASYTQLAYWQVYSPSPYFRETNYEPQIFLRNRLARHWLLDVGLNHQSNGRGSVFERSWNRLFFNLHFSRSRWLIDIKPWIPVFTHWTSNAENKDIAHFMGHEQIRAAYHWRNQALICTVSNIESGLQRGFQQFEWVVPLTPKINLLFQYFHGYGQSMIEYRHRTHAMGIGFSLTPY